MKKKENVLICTDGWGRACCEGRPQPPPWPWPGSVGSPPILEGGSSLKAGWGSWERRGHHLQPGLPAGWKGWTLVPPRSLDLPQPRF